MAIEHGLQVHDENNPTKTVMEIVVNDEVLSSENKGCEEKNGPLVVKHVIVSQSNDNQVQM